MSEAVDLPPVHIAELDHETLARVLDDIEHAAELVALSWKGAPDAYATAGADDAPTSRSLLRAQLGLVRAAFATSERVAVQLRYRFQGQTWRDTLFGGGPGQPVRLVRICEEDVERSVNADAASPHAQGATTGTPNACSKAT